jgi:hypothetical protein
MARKSPSVRTSVARRQLDGPCMAMGGSRGAGCPCRRVQFSNQNFPQKRHSFIAQNLIFSRKRHSFIAQNQNFPQKRHSCRSFHKRFPPQNPLLFCNYTKDVESYSHRCQENAYYSTCIFQFSGEVPQTPALGASRLKQALASGGGPAAVYALLQRLHPPRSRNPGSAPAMCYNA